MKRTSIALLAAMLSACAYHAPLPGEPTSLPAAPTPATPSIVRLSAGPLVLNARGSVQVTVWLAGIDGANALRPISGAAVSWSVSGVSAYTQTKLNNVTDLDGLAVLLLDAPANPADDSIRVSVDVAGLTDSMALPVCRLQCAAVAAAPAPAPAPTPAAPAAPVTPAK